MGDVWDVKSGITFTNDVDLLAVQVKGIYKVSEEAQELSSNIFFGSYRWLSLREAGTNRSRWVIVS